MIVLTITGPTHEAAIVSWHQGNYVFCTVTPGWH